MRTELSIFNVKDLKRGDIVFVKDPKTGEEVDLKVDLLSPYNKIYLTTLDSDLDGYNNSQDENGEYGSYGDFMCHLRTLLAPESGAAAITRDHLIFTLISGEFKIDRKGTT
jgi:hypothetical protein